tara:strand:- start:443 stop:874 length:432 start_codon:yes stop_codon:yes gene_type:complete
MFKATNISSIYLLQRGGIKEIYQAYTISIWVDGITEDEMLKHLLATCKNSESVSTDEITHIISCLICLICNSVKHSLRKSWDKFESNISVKKEKVEVKSHNISAEVSYDIQFKIERCPIQKATMTTPLKIIKIKPICMISGKI